MSPLYDKPVHVLTGDYSPTPLASFFSGINSRKALTGLIMTFARSIHLFIHVMDGIETYSLKL